MPKMGEGLPLGDEARLEHPRRSHVSLYGPRKGDRHETEAVARCILRLIYMATDGRPREGHALSRTPGITAAAVMYARGRRWIELSDKNRVYLTDEGRRLVIKEAN
jgi:hypothetical protein